MGKRKHGELSSSDHAAQASSKRASLDSGKGEAVKLLQQHIGELAACLSSPGATSAPDIHELAALCRKLLPAFQTLSDSVGPSANSNAPGSSDEAQATPPLTPPRMIKSYIPPLGSLKAWTVSEIPKNRPPLPSISDPELEKAALTHSAMAITTSGLNYEVLEFIGDAFIYHVASELISQTFPKLTPGQCTQVRELLVRNVTLAEYSEHYGLHRRVKVPEEFLAEGRAGGTKASQNKRVKTLGDVFEAYVGALIHSDAEGVAKAIAWLRPLWAMTIEGEIKRAERQEASLASRPDIAAPNGQLKSYKQQLMTMIGVPGVKINYKDVPNMRRTANNLPLFSVSVHVEAWGAPEQFLGRGSGLSKKEAGEKAAEMALENKKAMKELAAKKQEHMSRKAALLI